MTTIRKILTLSSLLAVLGFAQGSPEPPPANNDGWDEWTESGDSTATTSQPQVANQDSTAKDTSAVQAAADSTKPADTTKVAEVPQDSLKADTTAADSAAPKKLRNKITYADYQQKVLRAAKKRSKTLHHGLSLVSADYHDKNYWHTDHDANWGMGMGMYYFYRRYIGNYLGFQGRLGALYRYSRWTFDVDEQDGKLSTGEKYTLVQNLDRKYYNFSADMPLTGKVGYHIKGTTTFLFASATFGLTKPIYEMTDTENRLYLKTNDKNLKADLDLISDAGQSPFPVYESHQTNKFFYMDDWETNGWLGLGIESRLISIEFQMFAIGGASQNANHRYYHIGHDSHPTWRMFLDFSIR
jgi:hypothetical protein